MTSAMSIDHGAAAPPAAPVAPRSTALRITLALSGLFEAHDGYMMFMATSPSRVASLGDGLIAAQLISHPLLAMAAIVLALIGRLREAVIAMAAILATNCLGELPSVVLRGLELGDPVAVLLTA